MNDQNTEKKKARILIVDDELIVSANIKLNLQKYGYEIVGTAGSADEAIGLAKVSLPDLVLMDINLKDKIDGIEVARNIQEFTDTAVVFLTAYSDTVTIDRARGVAPYGYLIKPFESSEMYSTIEMALYKHSMEKRIKESEKRFRELFDNTPIAYQSLNSVGVFIDVNDDWLQLMGYSREEVIGKSFGDFWTANTKPHFSEKFDRFLKNGRVSNSELALVKKNNETITVILTGKIQHDAKGNVEKTHCIIVDISKRKQLEEKLKESEKKYRSIFENVQDVYFETSIEGTILEVSPSIDLISKGQYQREELIGQSIYNFYPVAEERQALISVLLEKGSISDYEVTLKNRDGSLLKCSLSSKVSLDSLGRPERIIGSMHDITDRKRTEETLRENEQNYRTLADSGRAMVWLSGTDKLCYYFNRVWLEFTGRSIEREMGNGWAEGVHPDDMQRCLGIYTGAFDKREDFSMEYRLLRRDGEYRWLLDDGSPRYDSKGEFIGYIGHCLDITERKNAQDELRRTQLLLEKTFASMTDVVFVIDPSGRSIVACNQAIERVFGYKQDEVVGKNTEFLHVDHTSFKRFGEIGDPILEEKGEFHTEYKMKRKDGEIIITENTVTTIWDDRGWFAGVVSVVRDITERKLAEEALQKKMDELQRFHHLTVGRELTMIELKKEVNELLKKTGLEEKYKIIK